MNKCTPALNGRRRASQVIWRPPGEPFLTPNQVSQIFGFRMICQKLLVGRPHRQPKRAQNNQKDKKEPRLYINFNFLGPFVHKGFTLGWWFVRNKPSKIAKISEAVFLGIGRKVNLLSLAEPHSLMRNELNTLTPNPIHPFRHIRALRRRIFFLGAVSILVFWALLYLPFLRTTPPWYGDEFFTLDVGLPLTHGDLANRALYSTFFSYAFNYQPCFVFLAGLFSRITEGDILGGRILCALIGLATALIGFWFFHRRFGFFCGLFFAIFLLGYPQTIIHYRWIYPHGMVGLALISAIGLLMRPARLPQDWKVGIVLILGVASHLLGVYATIASVACRLLKPKSWLPVILPSALFLLSVFLLLNLALNWWPAEDLSQLLRSYEADSKLSSQGFQVINSFAAFFTQDYFHVLAFLGFFLCLKRRTYMFSIVALIISFLILRNRQNLTLFYYQALVILPILAAMTAVGFYGLIGFVGRRFAIKKRVSRAIKISLLLVCTSFGLIQLSAVLSERLPVRISAWVVDSIPDYEAAAKWLNQETSPNDLVIAHWNLGWMLHCRNADVLMATAWTGMPAGNFLEPAPARERFRYPLDIHSAKFFTITHLDEIWAFHQKSVPIYLKESGIASWPLVFQAGTVRILKNPNL